MWEWVSNIMTSSVETWTVPVVGGIEMMGTRLAAESEIRIYVDNTPNFGNQASSVLLMKTLIDLYGFSGLTKDKKKLVTILYKAKEANETRKKLSILLQGFNYTNPDATAEYKEIPIRFMTVEALMLNDTIGVVNYGFSGGADKGDGSDEASDNWFAKNCKVNCFLRLQAYLWPYPQQIQYGGANSGEATFDLNANVGNGGTFQNTGWYILDKYWQPSPEDWSYYKDASNPGVDAGTVARTKLAEVLATFLTEHQEAVRFLPLYGVKQYPNQIGVVPWVVLSSVVATALGGSNLLQAKTPTVVVSMNDDIDSADFFDAYYISKGEKTSYENDAFDSLEYVGKQIKKTQKKLKNAEEEQDSKKIDKYQKNLKEAMSTFTVLSQINIEQETAFSQRKNWLTERNSVKGVTFASSKERIDPENQEDLQVDPSALSVALATLIAPDTELPAILFLELGSLPTILFNYIFSLASFPSVFEGANSANLTLNLGACYLRMQDPNKPSNPNRYPDVWALKTDAYTPVHGQSVKAANAIVGALNSSKVIPASQFLNCIGDTTGYIEAFYIKKDKDLLAYYQQIKAFFHDQTNDKLGIGLACLNQAAIYCGLQIPS